MINISLEKDLCQYVTNNIATSSYKVVPYFSLDEIESPHILVGCGRITEEFYDTEIFNVETIVQISTQIDDVENPLEVHQSVCENVYELMKGANLGIHIPAIATHFLTGIDNTREDRSFVTTYSYTIFTS